MATDPIDTILATVIKADSLDLKNDPNHRLQGSFVWNRAHTLQDDDNVPSTILAQRVQAEYTLIKQYIDSKLGHDRKSGPLMPVRGGTGDKSPPHLDLRDLAKQRTSDLTVDPQSARAAVLNGLALGFTNDRERRVLAIVWRAAYLETDLWTPSPDQTSATLNTDALDELLDRRLRACERMAYNVSGIQAMLDLTETDDIPRNTWNLTNATLKQAASRRGEKGGQ